MSEVKPCPVCAGPAIVYQWNKHVAWAAECMKEECCKLPAQFKSLDDAIKAWNHRANDQDGLCE